MLGHNYDLRPETRSRCKQAPVSGHMIVGGRDVLLNILKLELFFFSTITKKDNDGEWLVCDHHTKDITQYNDRSGMSRSEISWRILSNQTWWKGFASDYGCDLHKCGVRATIMSRYLFVISRDQLVDM